MRPWLHIPALIFIAALILVAWVAVRAVPWERQAGETVMAAALKTAPPAFPSEKLSGWVFDPEGAPAAGADLVTQQDGRLIWTKTDPNGHFAMSGLHSGPLQLTVLPDGRVPEVLAVDGPGTKVRLVLERVPEPVPMLPQVSSSDWFGRVRNPIDPNRTADFEVWLVPTGAADEPLSGVPRRTQTEADGTFYVPELIHADYGVHVLAPGSKGSLSPNLLTALGENAPLLQHGTKPFSSELELKSGGLLGQVLFEDRPVRSAMVMLEAWTQGESEAGQSQVLPPVQTDREGRWSVIDLPPARYRVRIRGGGLSLEQEIDLGENQQQRVVW